MSAPACHATLKGLDARGLVHFRRVSNVHLYKVNPENYLIENVFARLFEAEAAMPEQLEATITKALTRSAKPAVVSLVLFGSMARGTKVRDTSDLDLLVVVPSKGSIEALEPKLEQLKEALFRRFHVPLSPYVKTLPELRQNHHRKLPLIREILKDGRTIYGKEVKELLP
ncbi:MAG: nucleotidyltransferase domain-containing protein [Elusimicrobia bacterium]|nr:nucleotidyltransferase domain-containing protein [Elusimicrobiota bacterium]